MKIFVVTPYFQTQPAWLQQAHDSVKAQTVSAHHILVCDGSAAAQIQGFQGSHIILPRNYRDYGNTPRLIGCYHAIAAGAEAIAFLDADNWFDPDHLAGLSGFARDNNLDACSSARMLHRLDGSWLSRCPQVNGRPYIDTSCMLATYEDSRCAPGLPGPSHDSLSDPACRPLHHGRRSAARQRGQPRGPER